ncbi:DUF4339 domain-containing protein [Opitutus sp. GAS368]|uniref:DUF4339 domain-containing protein n=1 Tax=Opitutus sp. GAS368 TaxID=1882749 RepID=UPI00087CA3D2|nr:DUF4339 domain-containing protein [Opitutus sp. GAS368]SDR73946.1 protein of unknown function [Opitutus sp. GAS368]
MRLSNDTTIRYFAWLEEEVAGPYTLEGLESLVYLGKITPDTLVCPEGTEQWEPIRRTDFVRQLFPKLSEKTTPRAWGRPGQSDRHDLKEFSFGEVKFEKVNTADSHGRIEVNDLLQEIRQAERDSGQDLVKEDRFRISKRSRDFWIMLIGGNVILFGSALCMQNTISFVFAIAGSGLFTWGLIWSMYGVMGKY